MGWFSSPLLFVSAVIASSTGFSIQNDESLCPPPEVVYPCTCSKVSGNVTALCENISNQAAIRKVFSRNPNWKLQDVHFDRCVIDYIPSSIVKTATFKTLKVTNSTLVSLFDALPVKTTEINIHLMSVKLLRGIQWEFLSNSSLAGFGAWSTDIRTLGKSFKEHMPPVVKSLWFEKTKIESITHQAFQRLVNLETLALMGGSLKKIKRDMFPRPWNIKTWDLSQQKLAALPNDIFVDLPKLEFFAVNDNFFTTISEEVFTKHETLYVLLGNRINCNCDVKWITTAFQKTLRLFQGKCSEPESFKGRELEDLTEEDFKYCR